MSQWPGANMHDKHEEVIQSNLSKLIKNVSVQEDWGEGGKKLCYLLVVGY